MTKKDSTTELLDLILMVSLIVREKVRMQSAKHQLSIIHLWMLRFVAENNNPTMRDIAGFLNISAPSATSFVETLIKEGFLERQEDEKDRRVVRVVLSKQGCSVYKQMVDGVRSKLKSMVETLKIDEQRGLEHALAALAKQINQ